MSLRIERVNELIHHALASLILRHVNDPGFNPALVTITHVITSPDLRGSRVLVSINAPPEGQFKMLGILKHNRGMLQHEMTKTVILKYTPHIHFDLDQSLAQGDHILGIISKLEAEHPDWPERPEPTPPTMHDETRGTGEPESRREEVSEQQEDE